MRRALQRVAKKGHSSSWPGKSAKRVFAQMTRASTTFAATEEDVDGRDKPDHDVGRGKAGYDPAAYFFSEDLLRGSSAGLT